jgi:hypothetical protein
MVTLDTLKVGLPLDALKAKPVELFRLETGITAGGEVVKNRKVLERKALPVGVVGVSLDEKGGKVVVEVSAKTLGRQYHEGINRDTVGQALEAVNKNKSGMVVDFRSLDAVEVFRADASTMFRGDYSVSEYMASVLEQVPAGRWNSKPYHEHGKVDGIVLRKRVKADSAESIEVYDKGRELLLPHNRDFMDMVGGKYVQELFGMVRVETRSQRMELTREQFGLEKGVPKLCAVLASGCNPILETFTRAVKEGPDLFTRWHGERPGMAKVVKIEGWRGILEDCNGDMEKVKAFIAMQTKRQNIRYFLRQAESIKRLLPGFAERKERAAEVWADFIEHLRKAA